MLLFSIYRKFKGTRSNIYTCLNFSLLSQNARDWEFYKERYLLWLMILEAEKPKITEQHHGGPVLVHEELKALEKERIQKQPCFITAHC
jgi:hypothetical protein